MQRAAWGGVGRLGYIQTNQSTLDIVGGPLDEHTQRPDDTQCCGTVKEHRAAETAPLNAGDVKAAPLSYCRAATKRAKSNRCKRCSRSQTMPNAKKKAKRERNKLVGRQQADR